MQRSANTSSSSHEFPMEPRACVEPISSEHSVFAHLPKDPNCEICLKTKTTRAPCRRRANAVMPRAEIFGDLITADHKVPSEESESRMPWWYKIWQHSGYNHTRVKQKNSQETQNLMKFPEKTPAWHLTKVRNKKEVIDEARNNGRKVHFASLMDLCHLKNSELEPRYQKYKGSIVLRGDTVKDDSGAYAVFTEQGSSASQ